MSDQEQTVSQEQPTSTETAEPQTLDQVYQEFKVEEVANDFNVKPQVQERIPAPPPPEKPAIPDPVLDPDGYKNWQAKNAYEMTQALRTVATDLQNLKLERARAAEEADIKKAVATVKEQFDAPDDFIEVALGHKARQDAKFLAVYNNRGKNPAAWNAALKAVGREFGSKYAFKADPQLSENVRAAKLSTQGSQSTQNSKAQGDDAIFESKNGRDFERAWESYVRGGIN